jgi:hypothetical protein
MYNLLSASRQYEPWWQTSKCYGARPPSRRGGYFVGTMVDSGEVDWRPLASLRLISG